MEVRRLSESSTWGLKPRKVMDHLSKTPRPLKPKIQIDWSVDGNIYYIRYGDTTHYGEV